MLSQEDKPNRHRSAREISRETAILCSSVHRKIIHRDLYSSHASNDVDRARCLKPIVSPVSLAAVTNNLVNCNKSCYCSIIYRKLNNK